MRSSELVGVAQPIACCGEVGGIGRRGEIAQRRVRTPVVVVVDPIRDAASGVIEAEEQGFIEKLISHTSFQALDEGILDRLARCDEVPVDAGVLAPSMALQVNSVPLSETIEPGLPRLSTIVVSSRATSRPEIDVSGTAPRHSFVTSSTMLRTRTWTGKRGNKNVYRRWATLQIDQHRHIKATTTVSFVRQTGSRVRSAN
jgi:hypothetical protein